VLILAVEGGEDLAHREPDILDQGLDLVEPEPLVQSREPEAEAQEHQRERHPPGPGRFRAAAGQHPGREQRRATGEVGNPVPEQKEDPVHDQQALEEPEPPGHILGVVPVPRREPRGQSPRGQGQAGEDEDEAENSE